MPLGVFLCYVFSVKYFIFETFTVDIGLVQKVLQNFVTIGTELKTKHLSWQKMWSFFILEIQKEKFSYLLISDIFSNELKTGWGEGRSLKRNENTL